MSTIVGRIKALGEQRLDWANQLQELTFAINDSLQKWLDSRQIASYSGNILDLKLTTP